MVAKNNCLHQLISQQGRISSFSLAWDVTVDISDCRLGDSQRGIACVLANFLHKFLQALLPALRHPRDARICAQDSGGPASFLLLVSGLGTLCLSLRVWDPTLPCAAQPTPRFLPASGFPEGVYLTCQAAELTVTLDVPRTCQDCPISAAH